MSLVTLGAPLYELAKLPRAGVVPSFDSEAHVLDVVWMVQRVRWGLRRALGVAVAEAILIETMMVAVQKCTRALDGYTMHLFQVAVCVGEHATVSFGGEQWLYPDFLARHEEKLSQWQLVKR